MVDEPLKQPISQFIKDAKRFFDENGPFLVVQVNKYQGNVYAICRHPGELSKMLSPLSRIETLEFYSLDEIEKMKPAQILTIDDPNAIKHFEIQSKAQHVISELVKPKPWWKFWRS